MAVMPIQIIVYRNEQTRREGGKPSLEVWTLARQAVLKTVEPRKGFGDSTSSASVD